MVAKLHSACPASPPNSLVFYQRFLRFSQSAILYKHPTKIKKMSGACGNVNNADSFSDLWNPPTVADERSKILAWLSPLEPRMRHQAVRTNRLSSVGGWLLQTEVFRDWSHVSHQDRFDSATLFYYGKSGVGKTYIT